MEDMPEWFVNLYLDFFGDVVNNQEKFKNTGTAKVIDEDDQTQKKGYAIHNPQKEELTFVGLQKHHKSGELEYCHFKTEYANDG